MSDDIYMTEYGSVILPASAVEQVWHDLINEYRSYRNEVYESAMVLWQNKKSIRRMTRDGQRNHNDAYSVLKNRGEGHYDLSEADHAAVDYFISRNGRKPDASDFKVSDDLTEFEIYAVGKFSLKESTLTYLSTGGYTYDDIFEQRQSYIYRCMMSYLDNIEFTEGTGGQFVVEHDSWMYDINDEPVATFEPNSPKDN